MTDGEHWTAVRGDAEIELRFEAVHVQANHELIYDSRWHVWKCVRGRPYYIDRTRHVLTDADIDSHGAPFCWVAGGEPGEQYKLVNTVELRHGGTGERRHNEYVLYFEWPEYEMLTKRQRNQGPLKRTLPDEAEALNPLECEPCKGSGFDIYAWRSGYKTRCPRCAGHGYIDAQGRPVASGAPGETLSSEQAQELTATIENIARTLGTMNEAEKENRAKVEGLQRKTKRLSSRVAKTEAQKLLDRDAARREEKRQLEEMKAELQERQRAVDRRERDAAAQRRELDNRRRALEREAERGRERQHLERQAIDLSTVQQLIQGNPQPLRDAAGANDAEVPNLRPARRIQLGDGKKKKKRGLVGRFRKGGDE